MVLTLQYGGDGVKNAWQLASLQSGDEQSFTFELLTFQLFSLKTFLSCQCKTFLKQPLLKCHCTPPDAFSPLKLCLYLQKIPRLYLESSSPYSVLNLPTKESVWSWREGAEEAFCGKRKKFKSCPSSVPSSWSSLPITIITVYDHCHDNHHSHHWWSSLSWRFKSLETVRSVPEYLILEATKFSGFNL